MGIFYTFVGVLVIALLFLIVGLKCCDDPPENDNMPLRPLSQINNYGSTEPVQRMENDILAAGYKIDGYDILNQRGQVVYTAEPVARGLNVWALSDNDQRYNLVATIPKKNYYMYLLNHENILLYDPQHYRIF
jgi:hypothetical protein